MTLCFSCALLCCGHTISPEAIRYIRRFGLNFDKASYIYIYYISKDPVLNTFSIHQTLYIDVWRRHDANALILWDTETFTSFSIWQAWQYRTPSLSGKHYILDWRRQGTLPVKKYDYSPGRSCAIDHDFYLIETDTIVDISKVVKGLHNLLGIFIVLKYLICLIG